MIANAASSLAEHDISDEDLTDARILIVDDNLVARMVISQHLKTHGFKNFVVVENGADGIKAASEVRPELIISDLIMPGMDGFEFCSQIRADPKLSDVPILIQTAADEPETRAAVFSVGATDLVTKPLNASELLARVRIHIHNRRLIDRLSEFQRRMAEELQQARAMQDFLLPGTAEIKDLTARYPLAISSYYEPSIGLGGDMWGVREIDQHRLMVYSADFAGHGVGAALNTFRLHSFISTVKEQSEDPAIWLVQANKFLCQMLQPGQFATMFCGVMDFKAEKLRYAAAASPANLLLSAGIEDRFVPIDGTGFPLGMIGNATYENHELPFPQGSLLFLFSDALIETPDMADPVFTVEKLAEFLRNHYRDGGLDELRNKVLAHLSVQSPQKPGDDLTIVLLSHLERR